MKVFLMELLIFILLPSFSLTSETFLLFTVMNEKYESVMINYTISKLHYAKSFGYSFLHNLSDFNLNNNELKHHPTALRIYAVDSLLSGRSLYTGPKADWLIYIDSDAFVAEQYCPMTVLTDAAASFSKRIQNKNSSCHFVTQDAHGSINTGFWMIRNSSIAFDFIQIWKDSFNFSERNGYVETWLHDQGALLNAMLHVAGNESGHLYDNDCHNRATAHKSNVCFDELMTDWSYRRGARKFSHICLLPESGVPFQHATHYAHNAGEFIWHKKNLKIETMRDSGYFFYNQTSGRPYLRNGTFVKEFGFKHKSIYVIIDNKRHLIPDVDTWEYLKNLYGKGKYMSNVVNMDSSYFERIDEGNGLNPYSRVTKSAMPTLETGGR